MALQITTKSSLNKDYLLDKDNTIFPAFVNGLPYESWNSNTTIATSRTDYYQLQATGGAGPIAWSVASGTLPPGLTISADGKLRGQPTRTGNYTFTVQATDGVETIQKTLSLTVHPAANLWHHEAKLGVYNNISIGGSITQNSVVPNVPAFEARIADKWNPAALVDYAKNVVGAKYIMTNAYAANSVALWPKTTVTTRPLQTVRNYIKEVGDAAHAAGLKFMVYFAPDSISNAPRWQNTDPAGIIEWDGSSTYTTNAAIVGNKIPTKDGMNSDTPVIWLSSSESAWGTRNTSIWRELSQMDYIDGMWIDVGAGDRLLNAGIEPDYFRWNTTIPILKYNDPWKIIGNNQGYNNERTSFGNKYQNPYIDYVIYEGFAGSLSEGILVNGYPIWTDKDMSTDTMNVLDTVFTLAQETPITPRDPKQIIRNIQRTWDAEGTYTLVYSMLPDGTPIPDQYKSALTTIGNFVKANQGYSERPTTTITGNVATISTTSGGRIFYTLDGTKPTNKSNVYTGPITLESDTLIKAISIQGTTPASLVAKKIYHSGTNIVKSGLVKLFSNTVVGDVNTTEANNQYKGIKFTVLDNDIKIYQIGRKNVGPLTGPNRKLYIKTSWNTGDIYYDVFDNNAPVEADGYRWSNIAPIVIKAGTTCLMAIQENTTDLYASNSIPTPFGNPDVRVLSGVALSKQGDIAPLVGSNTAGQYLNFKYEVLRTTVGDKALGKPAVFQHHTTNAVLGPNAVVMFASNAVDGDYTTYANPSGDTQAVIKVDLGEITKVKGLKLKFRGEMFPSEFYISTSIRDNAGLEMVQIKTNNYLPESVISFDPRDARYVYFRLQTGSWVIENMEIYKV